MINNPHSLILKRIALGAIFVFGTAQLCAQRWYGEVGRHLQRCHYSEWQHATGDDHQDLDAVTFDSNNGDIGGAVDMSP